jgi:hypothetical protein
MGFKRSKGTRKDLKKLLKMVTEPDTRSVAVSVAGALAGSSPSDSRSTSSTSRTSAIANTRALESNLSAPRMVRGGALEAQDERRLRTPMSAEAKTLIVGSPQ